MRKTLPAAVAALVTVIVVACSAPLATPSLSPERSGGILRVGQAAADIGTADPHYASSTPDRALVDMVFNGLIRFTPGDATSFEPDLAAAVPEATTSNGGKQVWTFSLRHGVMCQPSDGVPSYELTSDDVVYSLRKAANKATSAYAGDYAGMTFDAADTYTVNVTLDKPLTSTLFYPRVANYSGGYILCKQPAEKLGPDGLKTHPVGTGPFMFKSYTPKDKIELIANAAYFRGKPRLDGIEYRYMPDLSSRELGLRSGQLDLIFGLQDGKWVDRLSTVPNLKVDTFGVGEVATIYFNLTKQPFDDLRVRQAVASALNRDEFLALYGPEVAEKVYSPVPSQFMAGGFSRSEATEQNVAFGFDPQRSKQLLQAAGLGGGFEFSVVTSQLEQYRLIYESMQAQLAAVGIKMNVQVVDHATMHDQIRKDVNPLVVYVAFRPTADAYLTQFFHSDSIVVTGKNPNTNFAHYDRVDDEINMARSESIEARQIALWKEAQAKALQDVVAYPVLFANQVYARASNLEYGHGLNSVIQTYPGINERTRFTQ